MCSQTYCCAFITSYIFTHNQHARHSLRIPGHIFLQAEWIHRGPKERNWSTWIWKAPRHGLNTFTGWAFSFFWHSHTCSVVPAHCAPPPQLIELFSRLGVDGLLVEYEDMFPYEGELQLLQATAQPAYRCRSGCHWIHTAFFYICLIISYSNHCRNDLSD